jgi:hypothetical protein
MFALLGDFSIFHYILGLICLGLICGGVVLVVVLVTRTSQGQKPFRDQQDNRADQSDRIGH